jgi:hypothetical protein
MGATLNSDDTVMHFVVEYSAAFVSEGAGIGLQLHVATAPESTEGLTVNSHNWCWTKHSGNIIGNQCQ